jgi:aryl-phospho-beta-D-glucosidase BglC (GH1 family)
LTSHNKAAIKEITMGNQLRYRVAGPACTWRRTLLTMTMLGLSLLASSTAEAQTTSPSTQPQGARWDRNAGPSRGAYTSARKKMPKVSVKANTFVDPDGKVILFRGLSISDPDKLEMQGHWNREHFVRIQEMGATLVRIPVHPSAWRGRTPAQYLKLLDQAVGWCTELQMYVMLDWHSIGNLETELFQDPMYETTRHETYNFWRTVARRYAGHNTVAFYELFNEPSNEDGRLGPVSWADWKKTQEELIVIIKSNNAQAIPLVAGFDWAYDLTPIKTDPINAEGIGYTVHPYANKRPQPWEPKWEEDFGFAAAKYPVIATEFGGFSRPTTTPSTRPSYGPSIIKYLEGTGISWCVWCFDPQWGPTLIRNWDYQLNASGEFAKAAMHGQIK